MKVKKFLASLMAVSVVASMGSAMTVNAQDTYEGLQTVTENGSFFIQERVV